MLKKLLPALLIVYTTQLVGFSVASAQEISQSEDTQKATFRILVKGIPEVKGNIRIAIFNSEQKYKEKKDPAYALVLPVNGEELTWEEEDLPYGEYAIAVYHDKNKNGKLDTNFLGIPQEAYGFSNGAKGRFGPASWKNAGFTIRHPRQEEIIRLR